MNGRWRPAVPHLREIVRVHQSMQDDDTPCDCQWCEEWRAERASARRTR